MFVNAGQTIVIYCSMQIVTMANHRADSLLKNSCKIQKKRIELNCVRAEFVSAWEILLAYKFSFFFIIFKISVERYIRSFDNRFNLSNCDESSINYCLISTYLSICQNIV